MAKYLLLDAARMKDRFSTVRESGAHFECLYNDRSSDDLADVAPYLCAIDEKGKALEAWVVENGLGDAWGTWVITDVEFGGLLSHFRQFLVKSVKGKERYFRFYDPRVLKKILPTYEREELIRFFGPVQKLLVEGNQANEAIAFVCKQGALQQEVLPANNLFQL